MAETTVTVDDSHGKGTVALFGDENAATEHLRDYLACLMSPLGLHLELVDDLASQDTAAMSVAMVGKALLRQVNERLDVLHERLREAGVAVLVSAEGKSWEPGAVVAMAVKGVPGKAEAQGSGDE